MSKHIFQLLASAPIVTPPKPGDILINGHEIVIVHSYSTSSAPDQIMVKGCSSSGLRKVPLSACRKLETPQVSTAA